MDDNVIPTERSEPVRLASLAQDRLRDLAGWYSPTKNEVIESFEELPQGATEYVTREIPPLPFDSLRSLRVGRDDVSGHFHSTGATRLHSPARNDSFLQSAARSVALLILVVLPGCRVEEPRAFRDAPVILISIDTLRADRLPAYGYDGIETPAFDRLAADGLVFENAYAHAPLTLPSHVSLLTGRLPWETGVRSNVGYKLEGFEGETIPEILAGQGYATGAAVSAYVLRRETGLGERFGFYDDSMEVWESAQLGSLQRDGDQTVHTALNWLDSLGRQSFFLFLHLFEPHSPYEPAEPFRSMYEDSYDGEVATTDSVVGRFLAELDRRGLYDESMIILVSDHGEGLGDHGEAEHGVLLYREAIHVPLIVKLPGAERAGTRIEAPSQLVDVLPTIASLTGATTPHGLAGTSLLDLATGTTGDRAIYCETMYPRIHLGWSELRSLIDSRHHFIESPAPELFDVRTDPGEMANLREERRREAHALAESLSRVPRNLESPGDVDPEEMKRLAALGYLSAAVSSEDGARRNPRDHVAVLERFQRTFVLNEQRRFGDAVALCREILDDYPELVDVHVQLAAGLRRLGRLDEAAEAYREAIRRSPPLVDTLAIEMAKLELERGNLDAAKLNAIQALELSPDEAHLVLAGIEMERGNWKAAESEASRALGDEGRPRIPALILLARALVEQGELERALSTTDRAYARIADSGAPLVSTLASTRGDVLARLGRNREAEVAFREEIEHFPTTVHAYVRLAILLASERRFDEIEPTLEAMVAAVPTPAACDLAARVMSDLGNVEGAETFRARGRRLAQP